MSELIYDQVFYLAMNRSDDVDDWGTSELDDQDADDQLMQDEDLQETLARQSGDYAEDEEP